MKIRSFLDFIGPRVEASVFIDSFSVPTYEHVNAVSKLKSHDKNGLVYVIAENNDTSYALKSMRKYCKGFARSIVTTSDNTYRSVFKECLDKGITCLTVYCDKSNIDQLCSVAKEFTAFIEMNVVGIETNLKECESVMKDAALDSDLLRFHSGLPSTTVSTDAIKILNEVRKSNGHDKTTSFRKHVKVNSCPILEQYKSGKILNVGESVSYNDKPYIIVSRGTNYVVAETEENQKKKIFVLDLINKTI